MTTHAQPRLGGWDLLVFFSQRGARRRAPPSIILVDQNRRNFLVSPQLRFTNCLFWYQTVILPYALVGNFSISKNFTHNFSRERENTFIHKDNTCNFLFKHNNFSTLCTILIIQIGNSRAQNSGNKYTFYSNMLWSVPEKNPVQKSSYWFVGIHFSINQFNKPHRPREYV